MLVSSPTSCTVSPTHPGIRDYYIVYSVKYFFNLTQKSENLIKDYDSGLVCLLYSVSHVVLLSWAFRFLMFRNQVHKSWWQ